MVAALITRAHAAGLARAGAGVLTAEQATVVTRALADAQTYRMREAAAGWGMPTPRPRLAAGYPYRPASRPRLPPSAGDR